MATGKRTLLTLPPFARDRLRILSKLYGVPMATLAAQYISEKLTESRDDMIGDLELRAKTEGRNVDELLSEWLSEDDPDPTD